MHGAGIKNVRIGCSAIIWHKKKWKLPPGGQNGNFWSFKATKMVQNIWGSWLYSQQGLEDHALRHFFKCRPVVELVWTQTRYPALLRLDGKQGNWAMANISIFLSQKAFIVHAWNQLNLYIANWIHHPIKLLVEW